MSVYIVTRAIQTEPVSTASTGADDKNRTCLAAQLYPNLLTGKWKGSRGAGEQGVREGKFDEKEGIFCLWKRATEQEFIET